MVLTNHRMAAQTARLRSNPMKNLLLRIKLTSLVTLTLFVFAPAVHPVSPPPDGGYLNQNTAEGEDALFSLTTGRYNTAIGYNALFNNTTGELNTAVGNAALSSNSTGYQNTAVGNGALESNTTGFGNVAVGSYSLLFNTTGGYNTAIHGMGFNTTGSYNTAVGFAALDSNTVGNYNTANGYQALYSNTTGSYNTATGLNSLLYTTTGISNTANGAFALQNNTIGINNTANGVNTLVSNTTGKENTANGNSALSLNTTGLNNTADGSQALLRNTTGNSNIALGFQAGQNLTIGSSNIDIGNAGVAGDSRKIRIGTQGTQNGTFVAGIYGVTVSRGIGVIVDSTGHLGTTTSSARFKDNVKPMDQASEAILALKPVTFRYKSEFDPDGIPQFGLVAEQVEKINPDLVARDNEGKPYTVRYEAVNAMLLNEFLKEHQKVEEQARVNERQEATIARLESALREQAAQIQKVHTYLEATKSLPLIVVKN